MSELDESVIDLVNEEPHSTTENGTPHKLDAENQPDENKDDDSKPETSTELDSSDKIDELTSLEREIAILHHVEPTPPSTVQKVADPKADGGVLSDDEAKERVIVEMQTVKKKLMNLTTTNEEVGSKAVSSTADRINGEDVKNDKRPSSVNKSELSQGDLQISKSRQLNKALDEGILENDDLIAVLKGIDDDSKERDIKVEGVTIEGEGEYPVIEIEDNETDGLEENPIHINPSNNNEKKKTKSHETLTPQEVRQVALEQMEMIKGKSRRRKQDIKPIQQPADLVTSLVSEWSDDDVCLEVSQENAKGSKAAPSKLQNAEKSSNIPKASNALKKTAETKQPPQQQPKEALIQPKKEPVSPPTGFRRTRVIKRKIIWDPDAPETQFSYANLVRSSVSSSAKKEPITKKGRITPSPVKKKDTITTVTVTSGLKAATKLTERPATPAAKTQTKRQSEAAIPNGNKKKKFSEVDRLLGDEGAVNMLNSLENERNKKPADAAEPSKCSVRIRNATPTPEKVTTRKDQAQVKNKRTPKPKASDSWDYVYKKQTEDSMIIRRRSNSSYSSTASNRLSLDGPTPPKIKAAAATTTTRSSPAASKSSAKATVKVEKIVDKSETSEAVSSKQSGKQFEFAKPENKNQNIKKTKIPQTTNPLPSDMKKAAQKRVTRSPLTADDNKEKPTTSSATAVAKEQIDELKPLSSLIGPTSEREVVVTMVGKVAQIMFNTQKAKIPNTFTVQLLNMLTSTLDRLGEDKNCNVAVVFSNNEHFCQGIDFTDIANGTVEKRKSAVTQMARAVKNFLQTLATFPKPIIASVNGTNSGLGVTMLPLFDIVVGSNQASFETSYTKIGQLPEGYCIWSESTKIQSSFKVKLLWLGKKLQSTESNECGLVNILANPNQVKEEALKCAKEIASFSTEAYRSMKKSTIETNLENVLTGLEEEHDTLLEQWMSQECLDNFKQFIQKGQW